jgi:hypothetical protein
MKKYLKIDWPKIQLVYKIRKKLSSVSVTKNENNLILSEIRKKYVVNHFFQSL